MSEPAPPCFELYVREGGNQAGDRIVHCQLPDDHDGDHDELVDGEAGIVTWPRAEREVPVRWASTADLERQLAEVVQQRHDAQVDSEFRRATEANLRKELAEVTRERDEARVELAEVSRIALRATQDLHDTERDLDAAEAALAGLALDVSLPLPGVTEMLRPEEIRARVADRIAEVTRERDDYERLMRTTAVREGAEHEARVAAEARLSSALKVVEAAKNWRAAGGVHQSSRTWGASRAEDELEDAVEAYQKQEGTNG